MKLWEKNRLSSVEFNLSPWFVYKNKPIASLILEAVSVYSCTDLERAKVQDCVELLD